jgi:peptidoglycan/xylan/chitin deacetylase (PgdA/CDA1 family)
VFCYHSISKNDWRFSNDFKEFKRQIKQLLKSRCPVTVDDVFSHINGDSTLKKKSFLITFDDGYKDVTTTREFLGQHNIKPIVFVLSDPKRADSTQLNSSIGFLKKAEILHLSKQGWTIGCHSATHQNFGSLNQKEIVNEIVNSKKVLERNLSIKINYFAYPKGIYNNNILKAVKKAGYKMAFSIDGGFISKSTQIYRIPRVGIDKTHTFSEFQATYSTPVLLVRKLLNQISYLKK